MIEIKNESYYHCFLKDNATSVCDEDNYFVFERITDNNKKYKTIPIYAVCKKGRLFDIITGERIFYVRKEEDTSHKTPGKSLISYVVKEVSNVTVADSFKKLTDEDVEDYRAAIKNTAELSHKRYEEEVEKMRKQEEEAAEAIIRKFTFVSKNN